MNSMLFKLPIGFEFDGHDLSGKEANFNINKAVALISVFVDNGRRERGWKNLAIPVQPGSSLAGHLKTLILNGFAVSGTHSVSPGAMFGQGLIVDDPDGYPCSNGCAAQVDNPDSYSQVFAVVNHPELGFMAVTPAEFWALGLPEFAGFPVETTELTRQPAEQG